MLLADLASSQGFSRLVREWKHDRRTGARKEMKPNLDKDVVMEALKHVVEPESGRDIITLDMVDKVKVGHLGGLFRRDTVIVDVDLPYHDYSHVDELRQEIIDVVKDIGAKTVKVRFSVYIKPSFTSLQGYLEDVKNVLVIASNKGGVGKTTVAVNIAAALNLKGARVGLLDADIYGPNVPNLLRNVKGIQDPEEKVITPFEVDLGGKYPLQVMSVGYLLPQSDTPLVWRAPLVNKLMVQFFEVLEWGYLDYLIVDLPPGTGDVQLNVAAFIPKAAAMFVTTPAEISQDDVKRGIRMFKKTGTKIIGLVENMSYFKCPKTGNIHYPFSQGGAEKIHQQFNLPILGKLPLDPIFSEEEDDGTPLVVSNPEHKVSQELMNISRNVASRLAKLAIEREERMKTPLIPLQVT